MTDTFFQVDEETDRGWTVWNEYRHVLLTDGSVSRRAKPVLTGTAIHIHSRGHLRFYRDGVLRNESLHPSTKMGKTI